MESEELISDINIPSDGRQKCRMIFFIAAIIVLLIVCVVFIVLYIKKSPGTTPSDKPVDPVQPYTPLASWNDCETKRKIMSFVENITNPKLPSFVPNENRIVVSDLDGTLFQETDKVYNSWKLYYYRVYNDPTFQSDENLKNIADQIAEAGKQGTMPDTLNMKIAETYGQLFKNMTLEEYDKYVKDYLNKDADGYEGLKRGDAFYKPMLELIEYFQKNNFSLFITSGTDRYQVRSVIDGHIDIPKSNVIGSDYEIYATNQGDKKGNEYEYNKSDVFSYQGTFIRKNLKTNKVIGILREIGRHPIISMGNSNGDSCMSNFIVNNKNYKGMALMVLNDDLERENGNIDKANKMNSTCQENGWTPISMKNDWKTIYGEKVKKKPIPFDI